MKNHLLAALLAATLVAACGGGGDDAAPATPAATSEVPASASASVDGFIAYLKDLVVAAADMLEPVDTSAVNAPTDETGDPQKVD